MQSVELANSEAACALSPREFERVRELACRTFGLDLRPGKEELVRARLWRLLRHGGFRSVQDYCDHVRSDRTGQSLASLVDALATNHTAFLREPEHFEFLRSELAGPLAKREVVEIWCAACATGEEAWTLAIVLNEAIGASKGRIVASDISNKALAHAERSVYELERCRNLPPPWLKRYFVAQGDPPTAFRVCENVRAQVQFRRINLIQPIARRRQFPVIFCRNVLIYFDREVQARVVGQVTECLEPGGYLFVGHAESLARFSAGLEYVRPAVYRKPGNRGGGWTR